MRVLLVHPEDSVRRGPWSGERWDLIVDLGRSSAFTEREWQEAIHCPILRADSFRRGVDDLKLIRKMFSHGRGRLLDDEGLDWWDLTSLVVAPEMEATLVLVRLAGEISPAAELWATRPGWPGNALALLCKRPVRAFPNNAFGRVGRPLHYARLLRRFSTAQIKQIFLDKYDADYRWRSRFEPSQQRLSAPVVLLPSAYENVSRMAVAYARLLPEQSFLLVATRESAKRFTPPHNVQVRDLATYAKGLSPERETNAILAKWTVLQDELCAAAQEFAVMSQAGAFSAFPHWFRDCMRVRDAWREVIEREPVTGVLCGDDSNIYTRLPVLLAARRKIPTVDFHHGALDGRYILKDLASDAYLAKTEMERDYLIRVCGLPAEKLMDGAPMAVEVTSDQEKPPWSRTAAILFSEAYENGGLRAEEIYREILPPLCRISRDSGHDVIVKLHPFESARQRRRLLRSVLSPEDFGLVSVVDGPLSARLLSQAWFGITIESTTVLECLSAGVTCFLCDWLSLSSYGYGAQYARFGVGEILHCADEIAEIPGRLSALQSLRRQRGLGQVANADELRRKLTMGAAELADARRIS